ncbi:hypothetical protein LV89_02948 [Arcicella aurantiaca]|uniref:LiaI-LiaF-like transmembrane region domain-containing protein n=1 Tax=Arcicella aurantiaca TaxID=591202 RepID=A0A316E2Y3_9BACT|nr:DUF5668 domain-containing protein [Arcicella aurantiaca]PWK24435.1 hypothetical protein LV89_02948 [Arcicella aurantiaca]
MNSKNIFAGGFLILLGILFLGKEWGWFHINWHEISRLWPLLLIYLGLVALLGKTNRSATVITIVLLCIAIPTVIVRSCQEKVGDAFDHNGIHIDMDDDDDDHDNNDDDDDDKDYAFKGSKQNLVEPMNASIKSATLNFSGGAAEFDIKETSKDLVEADAELNFGNISLKKTGDADSPKVDFALKGKTNNINIDEDNHNKVNLKLNPEVIWDMNFEFGAGKADFDLSQYKIKNLSIKTGLTETDVKLGDKTDNLDVKIESGLTDIEFQVPESVGCRIDIDGGLNDKDFDGFIQKNGHWETPNFDKSTKKINLKFEGGLQSLKVRRY